MPSGGIAIFIHPLRCTFKSLLCVNFLSQSGQANGFSPVRILRCTLELFFCLNSMSHPPQANGLKKVNKSLLMWIAYLREMKTSTYYKLV